MNWHLLTPFGNAILVWPVAAVVFVLCAWQGAGARRAAGAWVLSLAGASALVAVSKIGFYGWGTGIRAWNLTCFSGHAVLAVGFWTVLGGMLVPPYWPRWRRVALVAGALLGVFVAVSRVAVRAHPPSEVIAGLLLGAAVAWRGGHAVRAVHLPLRGELLLLLLVVLMWWGGSHLNRTLPTEKWFGQVATALSGREKPYTRGRWLKEVKVPPTLPAVTPLTSSDMTRL